MKMYAVRDRMINYFLPPFVGEGDRQVMASLAAAINNTENLNAIAQAPHHFEVWSLCKVDEETGQITEDRKFIADCSSLVRPGLRKAGESGAGASEEAASRSQNAPGRVPGPTPTEARAPQGQAPATPVASPGAR